VRAGTGYIYISSLSTAGAQTDLTPLSNLEKPQRVLIDCGALAVARSKVVNDGALVRVGPGVPPQGDFAAGGNRGVELGVRRVSVANDIRTLEG
jgi:hypothetical protein